MTYEKQCADLIDRIAQVEDRDDVTIWRPILREKFGHYRVDHSDKFSRLRDENGDQIHSWLKNPYGQLNVFRTREACAAFIESEGLNRWFEPAAIVGVLWSHIDCLDAGDRRIETPPEVSRRATDERYTASVDAVLEILGIDDAEQWQRDDIATEFVKAEPCWW